MKKKDSGERRNFWTGTSYSRVTPHPPTETRKPSSPGLFRRAGKELLSFVLMIGGMALFPVIWSVALVAAIIDLRVIKRGFRHPVPPKPRIEQPFAESEQGKEK